MRKGRRSKRRGIFWIAALAMLAIVGLAVMAFVPSATEKLASAFRSSTTAIASQPQQVAQAPAGKSSRSAGDAENTRTTRSFGGWTVVCNEGGEPVRKVCSANFRVINKENNANLLVWLVGYNAEGQLLSEFLTLTDVLIQPGVAVTLQGGQPVTAPFVECSTRGCKARLGMSGDFVAQLKSATSATIAVTRLDGQIIQFQMEIPGIDEALAELGA